MQLRRHVLVVLILSLRTIAETPPAPCPASRPVDDIIAELHKQESKKSSRSGDPLPRQICIWGWCRGTARTPPTVPRPAPQAEAPAAGDAGDTSSSKTPADKCNEATELALEAAHNVDVGDYSFDNKNYHGALFRYQDAAKQKPGDPAIHVRLGRVLEKLNQLPQAIEQYRAAEKVEGPNEWSEEARTSLARLQRSASASQ